MTTSGIQKSISTVAIIEAAKGALVLVAGFGLLELLHKDAHAISCELVSRLHLNPAQGYPRIFIDLSAGVTDGRLWFFAAMAVIYALLRFTEAYGLWKDRIWANWLALASGAIYLPLEIYDVVVKTSFIRVSALIANLVVVGIVAIRLKQKGKPPKAAPGPRT